MNTLAGANATEPLDIAEGRLLVDFVRAPFTTAVGCSQSTPSL